MKPDAQNSAPSKADAAADAAFELFLAPARKPAEVSGDLMARILGDALEVSGASLAPAIAAPAPRQGIFSMLAAALGGWPVLGGMASATLAGIWLGFTSPALLDQTGLTANAYSIVDLMPSVELAMADLDWSE